jgi:hypothetical protein
MAKVKGKVTDFFSNKKYGYIEADGDKVYFRQSDIVGRGTPSKGQEVLFIKNEVPPEELRPGQATLRATEVELIGGSKDTKSKPQVVESRNEEKDGVILSPNSSYTFWISNFTGSIKVSSSTSLEYRHGVSKEIILGLTRSGTLVIPPGGLLLLVKMRSMESHITFDVPGSKPVTFHLQFKT